MTLAAAITVAGLAALVAILVYLIRHDEADDFGSLAPRSWRDERIITSDPDCGRCAEPPCVCGPDEGGESGGA